MSHADKRARVADTAVRCIRVRFGEAGNRTIHTFAATGTMIVQTPDGGEARLALTIDDRGAPCILGHGEFGTVLLGTLHAGAGAHSRGPAPCTPAQATAAALPLNGVGVQGAGPLLCAPPPRTVAVKLQPANSDGLCDDLVDSDVIIEGAVLAATTRRGGSERGVPALRATALLPCTCCTEPLVFALFACDVAPGEALSVRSVGSEGKAGPDVHTFRLEGRELRLLALNLARTLAFLHSLGIYHGDLKPSHVLLERRTARVSLIDFGLACDVGRVRREVYTVWWRAPEVWANARAHEVGTASDVWAYALCVLAAADAHTYNAPSTAHEAHESMRTLQRRVREALSADRELGELMSVCLDDSAARRPTADQLVCTLQDMLAAAADGATSTPVGADDRTPTPSSPMSTTAGTPVQTHRGEDANATTAATATASAALDWGPLECFLNPFCALTLTKEARTAVGAAFLTRATERVRASAEHIFARLAAWPDRREAAVASMGLALRLHWPVPALELTWGTYLDFHVESTYAGYDYVLKQLCTPEEATALLERALVELRWDVLF